MSFINDRNNNVFFPCYHTDSIDSNRNLCAGLTISKNSHDRHFLPCLFDLAKNDSAKIRESCCATDNFSGKLLPTSYVNPVNESLSISAAIHRKELHTADSGGMQYSRHRQHGKLRRQKTGGLSLCFTLTSNPISRLASKWRSLPPSGLP